MHVDYHPRMTLRDEMARISAGIEGVTVERMDYGERVGIVEVRLPGGAQRARLQISFPAHYPNGAAPAFTFLSETLLPASFQASLKKVRTADAAAAAAAAGRLAPFAPAERGHA